MKLQNLELTPGSGKPLDYLTSNLHVAVAENDLEYVVKLLDSGAGELI